VSIGGIAETITGAPRGSRNGNYRHGRRTVEATADLLTAGVLSGVFCGACNWWIELNEMQAFAESLRRNAFTVDDYPLLECGHWKDGQLAECFVRIAIKPYNARGTLLAEVTLATVESIGQEHTQPTQSVTARFFTEYAAVDRFASALTGLLAGTSDEARLIARK
jgi:hypothetical protein